MRPRCFALILAAVGVFAAVSAGYATTVRQLDTRGLVTSSREIVIGKVAAVKSFWNERRSRIYTQVDLDVSRTLKGGASERVTLLQLGGEVDGARYQVPGCPAFKTGEEALFFVWRDDRGRAQVTGLAQGKFDIQRDPASGRQTVQRMLPGLGVKDVKSLKLVGDGEPAPRLALDDMVAEIERVLAEGGR